MSVKERLARALQHDNRHGLNKIEQNKVKQAGHDQSQNYFSHHECAAKLLQHVPWEIKKA